MVSTSGCVLAEFKFGKYPSSINIPTAARFSSTACRNNKLSTICAIEVVRQIDNPPAIRSLINHRHRMAWSGVIVTSIARRHSHQVPNPSLEIPTLGINIGIDALKFRNGVESQRGFPLHPQTLTDTYAHGCKAANIRPCQMKFRYQLSVNPIVWFSIAVSTVIEQA